MVARQKLCAVGQVRQFLRHVLSANLVYCADCTCCMCTPSLLGLVVCKSGQLELSCLQYPISVDVYTVVNNLYMCLRN